MAIICPNCATSYAIGADKLGTGRTVRCARCREVWTAHPELELVSGAHAGAQVEASHSGMLIEEGIETPVIDSPPLAVEWPISATGTSLVAVPATQTVIDATPLRPAEERRSPTRRRAGRRHSATAGLRFPSAVAALGALVAALLIWRTDVVRLMPQTAAFYKTIGLEVNLRGLSFRDVKVGSETVDGQPVLLVEGAIIGARKNAVEIPRLRAVLRDAKGAAIYAWNFAAEQSLIQPGERVDFRSRLAQPPQDAQAIDVRFFHKRDLAGAT